MAMNALLTSRKILRKKQQQKIREITEIMKIKRDVYNLKRNGK